MIVLKMCRVEALSTAIAVGAFVHSGEPFGLDLLGREVRGRSHAVILAVQRHGDGWLVSYREAAERRYPVTPC